jgi:hypothetical protein
LPIPAPCRAAVPVRRRECRNSPPCLQARAHGKLDDRAISIVASRQSRAPVASPIDERAAPFGKR